MLFGRLYSCSVEKLLQTAVKATVASSCFHSWGCWESWQFSMVGVWWVLELSFLWLKWMGKDLELLEQEHTERTDLSVWGGFKGLLYREKTATPVSWLRVTAIAC